MTRTHAVAVACRIAREGMRPRWHAARPLLLSFLVAIGARTTEAASFRVNSTLDAVDASPGDGACASFAGDCTLRAAIQETNSLAGADTIVLPAGVYALTVAGQRENLNRTGDLDILADLAIHGEDAATTVIDGGGLDGVLDVPLSADVLIENVSLRNGGGPGVRLVFAKNATVCRCRVEQCTGGGIVVEDILPGRVIEIADSMIAGNGGGIRVSQYDTPANNASVLVSRCVIDGNVAPPGLGGGIDAVQSVIMVRESVVSNNSTGLGGGGIQVQNTKLTIDHCNVVSNTSPVCGGINAYQSPEPTRVLDTSIDANEATDAGGGGICVFDQGLFMLRSSASGNSGTEAGGLWVSDGEAILLNSTVSGNTADSAGGIHAGPSGRWPGATVHLHGCTIAANTALDAGGIFVGSGPSAGTLEMANTLVTDNVGDPASPDISGDVVSLGYNLVEDPAGWTMTGDLTGNLVGVDPLLGPLQDNGGPTYTHALLAGSPAIDAANPAGCDDEAAAPLATDQRGVPRALDGDGDGTPQCDIGAYESCGDDGDADGWGDECDCAPADPSAFAFPAEPTLLVTRPPASSDAQLDWTDVGPLAGTSFTYEVASDLLTALRLARSANGPCVATALASPAWRDARPLPAGDGFYYLARAVNACGPAPALGWGIDSLGVERPACP